MRDKKTKEDKGSEALELAKDTILYSYLAKKHPKGKIPLDKKEKENFLKYLDL